MVLSALMQLHVTLNGAAQVCHVTVPTAPGDVYQPALADLAESRPHITACLLLTNQRILYSWSEIKDMTSFSSKSSSSLPPCISLNAIQVEASCLKSSSLSIATAVKAAAKAQGASIISSCDRLAADAASVLPGWRLAFVIELLLEIDAGCHLIVYLLS